MLSKVFMLLVVSLINMELVACHNNWKKLSTDMEDLNSQTDYLITIYSATNNKPCFYFGTIISLFSRSVRI